MLARAECAEPDTQSPLTLADRHAILAAQQRAAKIRRAARVASFNGWTLAALALLSVPFMWSSVSSVLLAAAMGLVAWNEFRGRNGLLQFDPGAARFLGWNQVGLMAAVGLYCAWQMAAGATASPLAAQLQAQPELASVIGSTEQLEHLYRLLVVAVYGAVMVFTVVFQGGNAWYYFSRRKWLEQHRELTPAWVAELQRLV